MEPRFREGHFFLALDDTFVVKARRIETTSAGLSIDEGTHLVFLDKITHVWQVSANQTLPLNVLEEKSEIGAVLADVESSLSAYEDETGEPPYLRDEAPVIFGADSLAFSILNDWVSDSVDVALSPDFLNWRGAGFFEVSKIEGSTIEMGSWNRRCSRVAGMSGYEFRILHPLDIVMQKLLQRVPEKFEMEDRGSISLIMELLRPSEQTLLGLLTENPARYRQPIDVDAQRRGYDQVQENTGWFLRNYLPAYTHAEVAGRAEDRHDEKLGLLAGV